MLIKEYGSELHSEYEKLVQNSINKLPYTVSHLLEQLYYYATKGQFFTALTYMLKTFELAGEYLSLLLLVILREKKSVCLDVCNELQEIVEIIDKERKLSLGHWCNQFLPKLTSIMVKVLPDSPLSCSLKNRTSPSSNLFEKSKADDKSIAFYRNRYTTSHDTVQSNETSYELLAKLEPRLIELLYAMEPLTNYIVQWKDEHYWVQCNDDKYDMMPLVMVDENGYEYIFQTLTDNKVHYISSCEDAKGKDTIEHNVKIDDFFQAFVPSFDIEKRLNWEEWTSLIHRKSNDCVLSEKKYVRELFVERVKLTSNLKDFLSSDAVLFPLHGEAGQGKTNQLCHWCEYLNYEYSDNKIAALFFSGSDLSGSTLEEYLREALSIGSKKKNAVNSALKKLHTEAVKNEATVVFLIDAMNECENYGKINGQNGEQSAASLLKDIIDYIVKPYSRFKVLFTCRNYTWKYYLQPIITSELSSRMVFLSKDGKDLEVLGFNDKELEEAYEKIHSGEPHFKDIARSIQIRLKDPHI